MNPGAGFAVGPDDDPDKYRLLRQVGGGGEAELWQAEVNLSGHPEHVAVKVLHDKHVDELRQWRARWAEQVDLLRLVRHPAVVGVHCQFEGARLHPPGRAPGGQDRALYLVMNWVDGLNVREWVMQHREQRDRVEGLRLLGQVATVLDWLHSGRATPSGRPVVHGDISPGNVMIDGNGQAVIVDFGLFRMVHHVTAVHAGTLGYCAPEIIERGEYSPASDRYAFGGLAYYVLTGTHPPASAEALVTGLSQVTGATAGPADTAELARMFAADPAARPAATQWLQLLRHQTSTAPVTSGGLPPSAPRPAAATVTTAIPHAAPRPQPPFAAGAPAGAGAPAFGGPPPGGSRGESRGAVSGPDAARAARRWRATALVLAGALVVVLGSFAVARIAALAGTGNTGDGNSTAAGLPGKGTGTTVSSGTTASSDAPASPTAGAKPPTSQAAAGKATPVQQLEHTGNWSTGDATIDTRHYSTALLAEACFYNTEMTVMLNRRFVRLTGLAGIDDSDDPQLSMTLTISADGASVFEKRIGFGKITNIDIRLNSPIKITIKVDPGYGCGALALADLAVS